MCSSFPQPRPRTDRTRSHDGGVYSNCNVTVPQSLALGWHLSTYLVGTGSDPLDTGTMKILWYEGTWQSSRGDGIGWINVGASLEVTYPVLLLVRVLGLPPPPFIVLQVHTGCYLYCIACKIHRRYVCMSLFGDVEITRFCLYYTILYYVAFGMVKCTVIADRYLNNILD